MKTHNYQNIAEVDERNVYRVGAHSKLPNTAEWKPLSLRRTSVVVLVLTLLLSLTGLELVDYKIRQLQGLSPSTAAHVFHYVPTVVAIMIGFAWRALASDFSMITPWATISNRHGHWLLTPVTVCGLLSGVLVPLTNTLSVFNFDATTNRTINIPLATQLVFNASLAQPVGWKSAQPLLNWNTARGFQIEEGTLPFQSTHYAFESFNLTGLENTMVFTTLNAFSSKLQCEDITYVTTYERSKGNASFILKASDSNACSIEQRILLSYNSSNMVGSIAQNKTSGFFSIAPNFWLNVTNCGRVPDDYRLLATGLSLDILLNTTSIGNTSTWTNTSIGTKSRGLICTPQYIVQPVEVAVNGSTGFIERGPFLTGNPVNITDFRVGVDIIEAMLNNPLDPTTQTIFKSAATNAWSTAVLPNSYNWTDFTSLQVMQKYSWLYVYQSSFYANANHTIPSTDSFFLTTLGQNTTTVETMLNDKPRLQI
ncbi:hypothetical protein LTR66_017770 [Elasticomyces elasticus]|nr:hypothetical protein LTR66_017770 [Elasticomyces elasticus]